MSRVDAQGSVDPVAPEPGQVSTRHGMGATGEPQLPGHRESGVVGRTVPGPKGFGAESDGVGELLQGAAVHGVLFPGRVGPAKVIVALLLGMEVEADLEPGASQLPQERRIGPGVSRNHEQGPAATVRQHQVAKTPKRADAQCRVADGLLRGLAVDGPTDVDGVVGGHGRILPPGPRQSITGGKRGSRNQEGGLSCPPGRVGVGKPPLPDKRWASSGRMRLTSPSTFRSAMGSCAVAPRLMMA